MRLERVVHPDGWESPVTYAIGRGDNYFLQVFQRSNMEHTGQSTLDHGLCFEVKVHKTLIFARTRSERRGAPRWVGEPCHVRHRSRGQLLPSGVIRMNIYIYIYVCPTVGRVVLAALGLPHCGT